MIDWKNCYQKILFFPAGAKNYAVEALKVAPAQFNLKQELTTLLNDIESCKFSAHAYR